MQRKPWYESAILYLFVIVQVLSKSLFTKFWRVYQVGDTPPVHTPSKPFFGVYHYTYQRHSGYVLTPQFNPV